jgi:hypothetical protein
VKKRFLCVALFLASPAFATISQVQSKANWSCSGTTCLVTFTSNPTLGNLIVVWTFWQSTSVFTASVGDSINYSNQFVSAVGPTLQSASNTSAQIFYAKNIHVGSGSDQVTVTFTGTGTISSAGAVIVEYSGADQSYPLDSVSAGYSTSGNSPTNLDSGAVAPANTNLLLFGGGTSDAGNPLVVASPFTSIQSHGSSPNAITEYAIVTGNNTLQRAAVGYNLSPPPTGNWVMQMAVFRDASWTVAGGWTPPRFAQILDATQFPGSELGAQLTAAYSALTPVGGEIVVPAGSYNMTTQFLASIPSKPVRVHCAPGAAVINVNGTLLSSAPAMTFDYGTLAYQTVAMDGCKLVYTGTGTTSMALSLGHTNGLTEATFANNTFHGFGTGIYVSSGPGQP